MNIFSSRLFSLFAALALATGCATAEKSKSSSAAKSGWIPLFDGKAIKNMRGYKQTGLPEKSWAIENGQLKTVHGSPRVDLITVEKFKDFELQLEWKVPAGGNSGVFYGVQETDGPAYSTGAEMQILDDTKHKDGQNPKTSAGALYALIAPNAKKTLNGVGEYNKVRIVSKNGHIEHWLNGAKIVEYEWNSPQLQALIADSKFKTMPLFMKNLDGYIGLQHHGEEAWFRNVRIRRL